VGDQNRSYGVALACLELSDAQQGAATDWLRRSLPRRTRVNLKPQGVEGGLLVARVERLDRSTDIASDLVAAGYGSLAQGCGG
ncbi:MAG: nuclease, partial [Cyanobacteriota bacterium]|nr:nuclease [Cyanobacteriota bacterium]